MLKCQNAEIRRHLLRYRVLALCYTIECIIDHSGIESDFFFVLHHRKCDRSTSTKRKRDTKCHLLFHLFFTR